MPNSRTESPSLPADLLARSDLSVLHPRRHHLIPSPLLFHTKHHPSKPQAHNRVSPSKHFPYHALPSRHVFQFQTVPLPVVAKPHTTIGCTIPPIPVASSGITTPAGRKRPVSPQSPTLSRKRNGDWSDQTCLLFIRFVSFIRSGH